MAGAVRMDEGIKMPKPWEIDWNQPRPVIQGRPDPRLPGQIQGDAVGNTRTVVQTQGDRIDNSTKVATQAPTIRKVTAEAVSAENTANGLTPEVRRTLQDRYTALQQLSPIIDDLGKQYEKNFRGSRPGFMNGGTGNRLMGSLSEIMPESIGIPFTDYSITTNPQNHRFNETARQAGAQVKSILGLTGTESNSAAEYNQKVMPYLPRAGDDDETIAAKLGRLRQMYRTQLNATQKQLGITPQGQPAKQGARKGPTVSNW